MARLGTIIESPDLTYAMGRGGFTTLRKFGTNSNVGTAFEDVWSVGGDYTGWVTTPGVVSVVSTSTDDTLAGSGARTVAVSGLDANGLAQTEIVSLSGTSPVTTTATFSRCWRCFVVSVGTYGGANAGDISLSIGGNACASITTGLGQSRECVYTVPADKTLYVTQIRVSSATSKATEFRYKIRPNALTYSGSAMAPWRVIGRTDGVVGPHTLALSPYTQIPPLTDIAVSAATASASGIVSAAFEGVLDQAFAN